MNIYQVGGLDHCERGFTRQIEVRETAGAYEAVLRYETLRIDVKEQPNECVALEQLIRELHQRGYTQLRTRLQFKGETYLGSQELWSEYADPAFPTRWGLFEKTLRFIRKFVRRSPAPAAQPGCARDAYDWPRRSDPRKP